MSSTRRAKPDADPAESPERYLANARLRGLGVGLNVVCRVACVLSNEEREAMIFFANYARLGELTGEAASRELGMPLFLIREALINPEHDRTAFVGRVGALRARFEAEIERARPAPEASPFGLVPGFDEALSRIADTSIARKVSNAVKMCAGKPQIVVLTGRARMGKSIAGRREYLRNLHRAAWLHCPKHGTERDFLTGLAGCLGMSFGSAFKNSQIMPKIAACFGRRKINLLFIDEGHRLLPVEAHAEPRRLETVRDLWETLGISIVILSTPQMSAGLDELMTDNPRYAPAQWMGRIQPFDLPETMTVADLSAVARHHAPDATPEAIEQLVAQAQASEGFCGAMVRAIERARFRTDGGPLTLSAVIEAQLLMERETRTAQIVALPTPGRRNPPTRATLPGGG